MGEIPTDGATLRRQARGHRDSGPITSAYGAHRPRVISVLNEPLATEEQGHVDPLSLTREMGAVLTEAE